MNLTALETNNIESTKEDIDNGLQSMRDILNDSSIDLVEKMQRLERYLNIEGPTLGFKPKTVKNVEEYLEQNTWKVQENANMGYCHNAMILHTAGSNIKDYIMYRLNKIDPDISKAFIDGDIHIHDSTLGTCCYCYGGDIKHILLHGFGNEQPNAMDSLPPKHFDVALSQICNAVFCITGEVAGAVSFNDIDVYLAYYILKDNLTYGEVKQAISSFIFNLCVKSRLGGQSPFSNVGLSLNIDHIKDDPVLYAGKYLDITYGQIENYQHYVDMFNLAFIDVMTTESTTEAGFSFPIPTYNVSSKKVLEGEVGTAICKMTAKLGTPYFANYISTDLDPTEVRSMCPLHGNTKVLIRPIINNERQTIISVTINELTTFDIDGFEVYDKGDWHKATLIEVIPRDGDCFTIGLTNGVRNTFDGNHLQPYKTSSKSITDTLPIRELISNITNVYFPIDNNINYKTSTDVEYFRSEGLSWYKVLYMSEYHPHEGEKFYCFQVDSDRHLFTLSDGLVTHNCRLNLNLKTLSKHMGQSYLANPNTGCYDDITEVLSISGWKLFKDLNKDDKVLSQNTETKVCDWYDITEQFEYAYDGELVAINNKCVDLCITPNHNQYLNNYKNNPFVTAEELIPGMCIPLISNDNCNPKLNNDEFEMYKCRLLSNDLPTDLFHSGSGVQIIELLNIFFKNKIVDELNNEMVYCTSNKDEVDYLQVLIQLAGFASFVELSDDIYKLHIKFIVYSKLQQEDISTVRYIGKVYCVTVEPHHTLCVRRNNKVCWSGNSIGVVTLNLGRYGYIAKSKEQFKELISKNVSLAVKSLEFKRNFIERKLKEGLYPYVRYYLGERGFKSFFSTLAIVGGHEACMNLLGYGIDTPEGKSFMEDTLQYMLELCELHTERTGSLYNLEASPAEGCCYSLALKDRKKFGKDIYISGGDNEPYYTNSTNLPVDNVGNIMDALEHQTSLQAMYSSGTVFHTYLGEQAPNPEAVKNFIINVFSKYKLPYMSITPKYCICPEHGYSFGDKCRYNDCESKVSVYDRVTGYYRPVEAFNKGKQSEFKQRQSFKI